ncbi:MAG: hypothetical protein LBN74_04860, partial [Prevotella sp.]|nr:hypothetical protein [Prevotella sp.]
MKKSIFVFIISILLFSGCFQINTENPDKAFEYWTQIPLPNSEIEAIKGKYWKSAHFTLEYEAFLKLKASKIWRNELININALIADTTAWNAPENAPDWFCPPSDFVKYTSQQGQQL